MILLQNAGQSTFAVQRQKFGYKNMQVYVALYLVCIICFARMTPVCHKSFVTSRNATICIVILIKEPKTVSLLSALQLKVMLIVFFISLSFYVVLTH